MVTLHFLTKSVAVKGTAYCTWMMQTHWGPNIYFPQSVRRVARILNKKRDPCGTEDCWCVWWWFKLSQLFLRKHLEIASSSSNPTLAAVTRPTHTPPTSELLIVLFNINFSKSISMCQRLYCKPQMHHTYFSLTIVFNVTRCLNSTPAQVQWYFSVNNMKTP